MAGLPLQPPSVLSLYIECSGQIQNNTFDVKLGLQLLNSKIIVTPRRVIGFFKIASASLFPEFPTYDTEEALEQHFLHFVISFVYPPIDHGKPDSKPEYDPTKDTLENIEQQREVKENILSDQEVSESLPIEIKNQPGIQLFMELNRNKSITHMGENELLAEEESNERRTNGMDSTYSNMEDSDEDQEQNHQK
ncbi:hypothetical protein HAX54_020001 [Datura stramonium]|uniref:Uncharacterized protein n=1 Tax=Datura stramonium TaxID=4076 RepID=A0ABS8S274_DATST|nr:hypothetical protein [Datura stramonium]